MRLGWVGLALFLSQFPAMSPARADEAAKTGRHDELTVGTQLVAVADVHLDKAALIKGSKVNVTKIVVQGGRVAQLDLELADGHVVPQVALRTVRTFFRVVQN